MMPCVPIPAAVAGIVVAVLATAWAYRGTILRYERSLLILRDALKVYEDERKDKS